jgi:adenine-specific DNA-methyltransferase
VGSRYDHLNREEMLRLLEARDQRDATRFGLVWEANEIERDKALNNDFVALDLVPDQCVGTAPWRNLIIEGDNYDALRYLRMTFAGQVKCILIDPPYNTGNNDFIYNDSFVGKEDSWRHSTWLEFMYRRLTLARELLSEDGVLFVHIGEEEMHRLSCLLDKVFPGRKVGTFVWRTRSGSNDSKHFFTSLDHEYVLCFANSEFSFAGSTKGLKDYDNPDNDPRGPWVSGDLTKAHGIRERPKAYYPIQNPKTGIWYPCNPERVWAFASESRIEPGQKLRSKTIEQFIRDEKILWPEEPNPVCYKSLNDVKRAITEGVAPKNLRLDLPDLDFWVGKKIGRNMPRFKKHKSELKRLEKPISTWIVPAATKKSDLDELIAEQPDSTFLMTGYTSDGTSLLREMLGNSDFPFPKPLQLIQSLIAQATSHEDIVLDFFGGSGTTAHAVLAQNAEDDGDRRFILVSTTEATAEDPTKNVCRDITQQRLAKAINGYNYPTKKGLKEVPGLGGDFAYLRTHRIQSGRLLEIEHAQVWIALQLAHFDSFTEYTDAPFLWAGDEESAICYVPRFRGDMAAALRRKVKESASVAFYSWQPQTLKQHVRDSHVAHLSVSDTLTRRFGLNLTLSPA